MTPFHPLSKREQEVLQLLLQGKSNKLIASALGISKSTVEFHLKNIYAKFQVSSRVELILKLGNTTGGVEIEKLGSSIVESQGENAENRDRLNSRTGWAASLRDTVYTLGQELEMKNLLNTSHVLVAVCTALFAGFLWVALWRNVGNMALDEIQAWILPLMVIWTLIGASVGLMGKHNSNTLLKISFSTLFGTGLSPIAVLPLMGFVVLPLGKLAAAIGLIDRSSISSEVATTLAIIAMLGIWLLAGTAIGILLLFLTIKKPKLAEIQRPASEPGL